MAVFLLTRHDNKRIRRAAEDARKHPITLEMLNQFARQLPAAAVRAERVSGDRPDNVPDPQIVELPLGWRLNISYEMQPGMPCLHLSMSSPTPQQTLPRFEAMDMVLEALGYDPELTPTRAWLEDFNEDGKPAGQALNMLIPAEIPQGGHA